MPAGETITLHGYTLPGGMLYVGQGLTYDAYMDEPSLLNPKLAVDARRPDLLGDTLRYWPSYSEISPSARAGYLTWLADGRREPGVSVSFAFLFFYGLERRILIDLAPQAAQHQDELLTIRREVQRLLDIYGHNSSMRSYASAFIDVLNLLSANGDAPPVPALTHEYRWQTPMSLTAGLALYAAESRPLPDTWALAWAWHRPEMRRGVAATRCLDELRALFALRYAQKYGDGLVVKPGARKVSMTYRPATAGMSYAEVGTEMPDVFNQAAPSKKVLAIANDALAELEPLARFLGRNPEGRDTLAAAALLPADLLGEPTGQVKELRDWAVAHAAAGAPLTGKELLARWPTKSPTRMAKPETVALAQLLEQFGLGIEPDVRLGGVAITPDTPVFIFETGPDAPHSPTAAYTAATTLLHLAVAVAAADGHTSAAEHDHLVAHLESSLHLTAAERTRLQAHLRWLTANEIKLIGLKKRIEALTGPQRNSVAELLIAVAAADGVISPEEVTSLTKIFKLLELDPDTVHTRLHAHLTGGTRPAPAAGPVTVRPAGTRDPGYPITAPPGANQPAGAAAPSVVLDMASIEAKFAETAEVSALLSDIFTEDTETLGEPTPAGDRSADRAGTAAAVEGSVDEVVAGLDAAHSQLLRTLAGKDTWSLSEVEDLAAELSLMPAGAIDRINEAVLDAVDEPFLDEDDPDTFTVNTYAREELFS